MSSRVASLNSRTKKSRRCSGRLRRNSAFGWWIIGWSSTRCRSTTRRRHRSRRRERMAVAHSYETGPVNIRVGELELRLAESDAEVEAAQALRYRVFYEEMTAEPTPAMAAVRRDFDRFDEICDHLLVIDHRRGAGAAGVIGTYRLLRRSIVGRHGRFYSAEEFDIAPLLA